MFAAKDRDRITGRKKGKAWCAGQGRAGWRSGFTLIEMAVVMAIIAVLLLTSVPFYMKWLANVRLSSSARELYGALMEGRGEAARRSQYCTMVFGQDIGGTVYEWVLFEDSGGSFSVYDDGETILASRQSWPTGVSLDTTEGGTTTNSDGITLPDNSAGNPSVTFLSTGIPVNAGRNHTNGDIYLTNTNGQTKKVNISQAGGITITTVFEDDE